MKARRFKSHLWKLITAAALLLALQSAPAVMAQCAMCRTAVESAGGGLAKSLNLGIIVLLIPPVAIFCAIFATAYKHRKAPSGVSKDVS